MRRCMASKERGKDVRTVRPNAFSNRMPKQALSFVEHQSSATMIEMTGLKKAVYGEMGDFVNAEGAHYLAS